jgi:hypothetical protein
MEPRRRQPLEGYHMDILTARIRKNVTDPNVVLVRLVDADGAVEYEANHYRVTARADVTAWAARVGVAVKFSKSSPA